MTDTDTPRPETNDDWVPDISGLITEGDPRTHKERMLAGDWFWGPSKQLLEDQARATALSERYVEAEKAGWEEMNAVARELFKHAEECYVKPPFTVNYGYNTSFGKDTFINAGAVFLDDAPITFGNDVLVGPRCQFLTAYHPIDPLERRTQIAQGKPIVVEDDAWIGAGSIILAGVTIGAAAIVGAGSVVTKDVAPRTIVAGNPAKYIRDIPAK